MSTETLFHRRVEKLGARLAGGKVGLEKESLRVDPHGQVSQRRHPRGLGSALTHPYITTDFSEALLELITPAFSNPVAALHFLRELHQFVYANLDDELIWATSMPCQVTGDESIPIAQYGRSNVARMKHVYRKGLSYRYGGVMQAIAGIHYNYSPPEELWPEFQALEGDTGRLEAFISARYFALIRNFLRTGWLVPYLFGASPAVCKSFVVASGARFEEFDTGTWFRPYATSLRMSDIGYKNKNQSALHVSYDGLEPYVTSLSQAIETPDPRYQAIGVKVDGEFRQLNANVLQIENEYYSFIRPKQVARSGEKPTLALRRRGVQYVEMRALDLNVFDPVGVGKAQLRFLEAFLLYCLLEPSPTITDLERAEIEENQTRAACGGRTPGLKLRRNGHDTTLESWGTEICERTRRICQVLDQAHHKQPYQDALLKVEASLQDASLTPSARMLKEMKERDQSFFQYAMAASADHAQALRSDALTKSKLEKLKSEAQRSHLEQTRIENADQLSFEAYLEDYFAQTVDQCEELLA